MNSSCCTSSPGHECLHNANVASGEVALLLPCSPATLRHPCLSGARRAGEGIHSGRSVLIRFNNHKGHGIVSVMAYGEVDRSPA